MQGYLGERIRACIRNRIFAQDPAALTAPFHRREERKCWQTEFWGKWALSAAAACDYTAYRNNPAERARLLASAHDLLTTQTPDGYIGNYAQGSRLAGWDIWGRKYTLLGLLAAFDLSGDRALLAGASRLAAQLETEVGPGKADIVICGLYRGMAASSVLGPVLSLFRHTGDQAHLRFAEYIVGQWSSPRGPRLIEKALAGVPVASRFPRPKDWFSWENGGKAYEMMSCYIGLLELFRETGRPAYLGAATRAHRSILDSEINVAGSGSSRECWYGGAATQAFPAPNAMETCVTTTWMRFSAHLLRLTGDPRFAGAIETSAYNALAGAMTPSGDSFAKYSSLAGTRELGESQCGMRLNCCMANGPRGLMLLPSVAVMTSPDGPVVNLYEQGEFSLALPSGAPAALVVRTAYPFSGTVELRMRLRTPGRFALRLRIPEWSAHTALAVNGAPVSGVRPGAYAVIDRRWSSGDSVHLALDGRARLTLPPNEASGRFVAVALGPLLLARDLRVGGQRIDDPVHLQPAADGSLPVNQLPPVSGIGPVFAAPEARAGEVRLCAFAAAGNSWDARSRFRVWMPAAGTPSASQS